MSLAEGIESGLSLGLKFASFYKDKEKDDLLIEKAKQDMELQKQAFDSDMETAALTREEKEQKIKKMLSVAFSTKSFKEITS